MFYSLFISVLGRILVTYHRTTSTRSLAIINAYVPCGYESEDIDRYNAKLKFFEDLNTLVKRLDDECIDVILVGDLNVKALLLDSAEAYENRKKLEFVSAWHNSADKILFRSMQDETFTDCFRFLHPRKARSYTCWNSGLNARVNNYGTRIDYVLVPKSFHHKIQYCEILADVTGSDHCPVLAQLDIEDIVASEIVPPECTIHFPELKGEQQRLSSLFKRKLETDSCSNVFNATNNKKPKTISKKGGPKQSKLCFKPKDTPKTNIRSQNIITSDEIAATFAVASNARSDNNNGGVSVKMLLTGLPKPPLCSGHQLKSVLKTVTKDGETKGKRFYCCSLPIGPSGLVTSRCNFFKWLDK